MFGTRYIEGWLSTHATRALSSAEAELYAAVKTSSELLGMVSIYRDFGITLQGDILGGASAALAETIGSLGSALLVNPKEFLVVGTARRSVEGSTIIWNIDLSSFCNRAPKWGCVALEMLAWPLHHNDGRILLLACCCFDDSFSFSKSIDAGLSYSSLRTGATSTTQ